MNVRINKSAHYHSSEWTKGDIIDYSHFLYLNILDSVFLSPDLLIMDFFFKKKHFILTFAVKQNQAYRTSSRVQPFHIFLKAHLADTLIHL